MVLTPARGSPRSWFRFPEASFTGAWESASDHTADPRASSRPFPFSEPTACLRRRPTEALRHAGPTNPSSSKGLRARLLGPGPRGQEGLVASDEFPVLLPVLSEPQLPPGRRARRAFSGLPRRKTPASADTGRLGVSARAGRDGVSSVGTSCWE